MSVEDMMKEHTIVDINEHIHVIDGKVLYYVPDTIDFEDENQVGDFFDMVSAVFVHELLPERYGKGNTCVVITGTKSDRNKIISMQGMHHFPSELKEKVQQVVLEYENQLKNEHIRDMMKQHAIINIDDYVHVIDGKVICYEPDVINFENEEHVASFFRFVDRLFNCEEPFLQERRGKGNTRAILQGRKDNIVKTLGLARISDFPPELLEKVKEAINETTKGSMYQV